jgi:hypothetical protein
MRKATKRSYERIGCAASPEARHVHLVLQQLPGAQGNTAAYLRAEHHAALQVTRAMSAR